MGRQLKNIKRSLVSKLSREPTDEEWAAACKLNVTTLYQYLDLSSKARNRLVQHNMRLVDYWVTKILVHSAVAKDIAYIDLVAEGVVGLTKAAERYDGRSRFGPYATFWIRSELYQGLTRLRPGNQADHRRTMIVYRALKAESELTEVLKRKPTEEEVAQALKIGVESLRTARLVTETKTISADTPVNEDNEENTYKDLFLKADQISQSTEMMMWRVQFLQALDVLTPAERRTLSLRFGLIDGVPKGVATTAELMSITPECVRKTIHSCLEKLRMSAYADILEEGPPKPRMTTTNGRIGAIAY